ncbi:hypothetical protein ISP17_13160 [Dyella ginsengisoli]|uniref:Uncharacterized protein n=1 Tax=Dyella ginsengisoli TaxID=363848 RepID=A0ABW8JUU0_9GAMM
MNYVVLLMGENFLVAGQSELQGFFITKRIEAFSEEIAAAQAVAAVRNDPQFSQAPSVEPTVTVKAVRQLLESNHTREAKYFFFPMETSRHERVRRPRFE